MQAYVQKWGNSLALRIPGNVVKDMNLKEGASVDMIQDNERLIIIPVSVPEYTLEELLDQISENNIHTEVDTGIPQGKEIW